MLDLSFMIQSLPMFAKALKLTLYIAFVGIVCSMIIGFICAWILFLKVRFVSFFVNIYVEISRNTPLLIQLFFLYYGLHNVVDLYLSGLTCAIIGLTFLGGGYMCESFRTGLESLPKSQIESAQSLGLNSYQMMFYVILPQSLTVSLASIGANVIFLIKETSVVSVIALADIMFVAKDIITTYYKTYEALTMLVLCYLAVLLPLSMLFLLLEKSYKKRVL